MSGDYAKQKHLHKRTPEGPRKTTTRTWGKRQEHTEWSRKHPKGKRDGRDAKRAGAKYDAGRADNTIKTANNDTRRKRRVKGYSYKSISYHG